MRLERLAKLLRERRHCLPLGGKDTGVHLFVSFRKTRWQRLGHRTTIAFQPWPAFDESKLARATMVLGVQVSGKLRSQIEVASDADEASILAAAKADDKVKTFIDGKAIKKEIYVKGRLVNLVV